MRTCTRRIEFDYGHRLLNHEAKCAHVHGHRGVLEITCAVEELDSAGRVLDFGKIKEIVGGWIDQHWDHAFLANKADRKMIDFLAANGQRWFAMPGEPSAENIASFMLSQANTLLQDLDVECTHVRFYETPNGWSDAP